MKHFNQMQLEFMEACGQPTFTLRSTLQSFEKGYANNPLLLAQVSLWKELINEEVNRELFSNLQYLLNYHRKYTPPIETLVSCLADDIGDSIYVLCGLANSLGIPIDSVFSEIHRSNMAKAIRQSDGTYRVIKRSDGKILKPDGWQPPDIRGLLAAYLAKGETKNE